MRNLRLISTLTMLFLIAMTPASAQFLDAATEIELNVPSRLSRSAEGYTLTGGATGFGAALPISGVAVRISSISEPSVSFQFMTDTGEWSGAVRAALFSEPNSDRFLASARGPEVEGAVAFRYSVVSQEPVRVISAGLFTKDNDEARGVAPYQAVPQKKGDIEKPRVISREEWGASPPKYEYTNHPYFDKLTLHHAAGWAAHTLEKGKTRVRSIQEFHQDGRGWNDIGYHFVVDMGGHIYQGRPETVIGAHVGGANTGNVGVCLLGCYHPPETSLPCTHELTKESEESLIHLYAWVSDAYGVDPEVLLGHRDYFGTTSCPGDNVWPLIPGMREDIVLFIEYGGRPVRYVLFQNYPNPFNTTTTIHYDLNESDHVTLNIYDILGRKVATLVNEQQESGYRTLLWSGKNWDGEAVAPGVYFYRAEFGPLSETKKMVLVK